LEALRPSNRRLEKVTSKGERSKKEKFTYEERHNIDRLSPNVITAIKLWAMRCMNRIQHLMDHMQALPDGL
jgi:hypothetical protein